MNSVLGGTVFVFLDIAMSPVKDLIRVYLAACYQLLLVCSSISRHFTVPILRLCCASRVPGVGWL